MNIAHLLTRPVGRPPHYVRRVYASFRYQAQSWSRPRRVVAKVEWHPGELYPRVGFIVTNLRRPARKVVAFYNGRGTAEQWIKEGKQAVKWTRLSCTTFRANAVWLQLHALAYNLANFLRTLALPGEVAQWSLTTLREKVAKIGARVVAHGRLPRLPDGRGRRAPRAVRAHPCPDRHATTARYGPMLTSHGLQTPALQGRGEPEKRPAPTGRWREWAARNASAGSRRRTGTIEAARLAHGAGAPGPSTTSTSDIPTSACLSQGGTRGVGTAGDGANGAGITGAQSPADCRDVNATRSVLAGLQSLKRESR
jgi:hypothetical protein